MVKAESIYLVDCEGSTRHESEEFVQPNKANIDRILTFLSSPSSCLSSGGDGKIAFSRTL